MGRGRVSSMMRRSGARGWGRPGTRGPAVLLLALVLAGAAFAAPSGAQDRYDVVIRDGRILDGSGNPWFRGDVAIRGARIVAVGPVAADAVVGEEIDARGLYVAPGFIDVHSHAGPGLASEDRSHARPLLAQGLATVVVNPDGGGALDLAEQRRRLEEHGLGVNVAQLVPHGSVRREVLGMEDRAPTSEELEAMRQWVRRGMEEGGFGLSSGPFYAPGSYSDTEELVALARVAARFGGVYTSHVRDESNYSIGVVAALDEVIRISEEAGLPGIHTHIKALGPPVWGYAHVLVRRIEAARARGVEVYADQYPYVASATGLGAALLPRWAQAGGRDSLLARFDRAETRARIREAMVENLARRGGADRIQFRRFEEDPSIEGESLEEVARERGQDPIDAAFALLREGSPGIVSFNMHEEDVRTLMARPWTMTSSDGDLPEWGVGVPHPRSYGAFPRKVRRYVLEEGVVGLEAAVRSMTSLPAVALRIRDRGRIVEGAFGDVVVFDLDRLRDRATFTDPHQLSEGVVHLFVNGRPAVRDGAFTDERAGRVLDRRGSSERSSLRGEMPGGGVDDPPGSG